MPRLPLPPGSQGDTRGGTAHKEKGMSEYIVKVKKESISYAYITMQADTVEEAVEHIGNICLNDSWDHLIDGPGDVDVESCELTIENITDEDGNTYADEDALLTAWETAQEVAE
jgi:hypothetical protein